MRNTWTAIVPISVLVVAAGAQQAPTQGECAAATAAVAGRPLPSLLDSTFLNWYTLAACGAPGEAAAAHAMRTNVLRTETSAERLREFFKLFYARRTMTLFAALKEGASSSSASTAFKLEAISALGALQLPGYAFDSGGLELLSASSCGSTRRVVTTTGATTDLPSDYLGQIVSTLVDQERRSANSPMVRALAHCWRMMVSKDLPIDIKDVKLKHICERRFRVTNGNPVSATVSVDVEGTNERHRFVVPAEGEFVFSTLNEGKVRLFVGPVLADKKQTASNRCDK